MHTIPFPRDSVTLCTSWSNWNSLWIQFAAMASYHLRMFNWFLQFRTKLVEVLQATSWVGSCQLGAWNIAPNYWYVHKLIMGENWELVWWYYGTVEQLRRKNTQEKSSHDFSGWSWVMGLKIQLWESWVTEKYGSYDLLCLQNNTQALSQPDIHSEIIIHQVFKNLKINQGPGNFVWRSVEACSHHTERELLRTTY